MKNKFVVKGIARKYNYNWLKRIIESATYGVFDSDGNAINLEVFKTEGKPRNYNLVPIIKKLNELKISECEGKGSWIYDFHKKIIYGSTLPPRAYEYIFHIKTSALEKI
jgi:hypothetical protein